MPAFSRGDRLDGGAEVFTVVQANVGQAQYSSIGMTGGGIEAAAKANFQHRKINCGSGEMIHRHRGEQFKGGELMLLAERLPALQTRSQLLSPNPIGSDRDALTPTDQMGGAVQAGFQASGLQDRSQGGAYGSLAIGTRHLHGGKTLFWMPACREGLLQAVESQIDAAAAEGLEQIAELDRLRQLHVRPSGSSGLDPGAAGLARFGGG